MRLLKRTQPEKGMVLSLGDVKLVVLESNAGGKSFSCNRYTKSGCKSVDGTCLVWNKDAINPEIIGKIGFNFEIKNGKLIKIKLPDISVDDVFEDDDGIILIRKTSEFGNYIHILYDDFQSDCLELREFKNSKYKHKGNLAYNYKIEGGV